MAPESMTKVYGVDALRASIMFGAPPEKDLNFDQASIQQFVQYLNRVFKLTDQVPAGHESPEQLEALVLERKDDWLPETKEFVVSVLKLMVDYEAQVSSHRQFHVALARLMEVTNKISSAVQKDLRDIDIKKLAVTYLTLGLYPFAPHIASEMWEKLAQSEVNIRNQRLPDYSQLLSQLHTTVTLRISLNGKFAGTIELPAGQVGDADAIFESIQKEHSATSGGKGKSNKKLDQIVSQEGTASFKRVIALADKPIVNFII